MEGMGRLSFALAGLGELVPDGSGRWKLGPRPLKGYKVLAPLPLWPLYFTTLL
jgi:hypothetical protein